MKPSTIQDPLLAAGAHSQCLQSFLVSLGLKPFHGFRFLNSTLSRPSAMKTAAQKQTWKIPPKLNLGDSEMEGLRRKRVSWREAFWRQSFIVSLAVPCSLWGQILEGSEGRVAGRRGRHSLHFAWRVCGGADAAEAAVQQIRRVTERLKKRQVNKDGRLP